MYKDFCPGYFDVVTGGVVGEGEEENGQAERELKEEMGIEAKLECVGRFKCESEKIWGSVFYLEWAGDYTPQREEVESVHEWTLEEM